MITALRLLILGLLLTACSGNPDNAKPQKDPVNCVLNGPCTGK